MATSKNSAPQPTPSISPQAKPEQRRGPSIPDPETMVWVDWKEPRPMPPHLAPLSTPKKPRSRLPKHIRALIEEELPERADLIEPPEEDNGLLRFGPKLVEPPAGLDGLALFPRGSLSKLTEDDLRWLLAVEFERLMRVERNKGRRMSAFEQRARREAHYERIGQIYQQFVRIEDAGYAWDIMMNELCAFWNGGGLYVKRYPQP